VTYRVQKTRAVNTALKSNKTKFQITTCDYQKALLVVSKPTSHIGEFVILYGASLEYQLLQPCMSSRSQEPLDFKENPSRSIRHLEVFDIFSIIWLGDRILKRGGDRYCYLTQRS
jgi:hypothetical protein